MTKRPEIVELASKQNINFLNDFDSAPVVTGLEACLPIEDPDLFFSDEPDDIAFAKAVCQQCPLIQQCGDYGMKNENHGVWGGLSPADRYELRGNKEVFESTDIDRLLQEKFFILEQPAQVVAARYEVDTRTIVRWRNTIRQAQEVN